MTIGFLAIAAMVLAQEAPQLSGTVTLRGGKALTGRIQLAELGVVEGAGIGNSLPGRGSIVLKVGDKSERVAGDDVAVLEVEWTNAGSDAEPRWEIKKITVTRKDGAKVEGAPDWLLHATNAWVVSAEGKADRVHVFPFGGEPFSPDSLIAKVEVVGGAAAPAQPVAPAPAPAEPTVPAPALPEPAVPAPAQPTAPAPAPAQPVVTAPAAPAQPTVVPLAPGDLVAHGTMSLIIRCPKCGELIKITITADAVRIEHLPAPAEQ
jgi:hypothetical protein